MSPNLMMNFAGHLEQFLVPSDQWETSDCPLHILESALYESGMKKKPDILDTQPGFVDLDLSLDILEIDPAEVSCFHPTGLAKHPQWGWFLLFCGQGPCIGMSEMDDATLEQAASDWFRA